jgi:type 1 glutamine amidotransferase
MILFDTIRLDTILNDTIRWTARGADPSSTIQQQGSTP